MSPCLLIEKYGNSRLFRWLQKLEGSVRNVTTLAYHVFLIILQSRVFVVVFLSLYNTDHQGIWEVYVLMSPSWSIHTTFAITNNGTMCFGFILKLLEHQPSYCWSTSGILLPSLLFCSWSWNLGRGVPGGTSPCNVIFKQFRFGFGFWVVQNLDQNQHLCGRKQSTRLDAHITSTHIAKWTKDKNIVFKKFSVSVWRP